MAPTNLIVNGTFDLGDVGWSGNDLETNHPESAYLGNGSLNSVAELDGNNNNTTVMEQNFVVADPIATALTLDTALRTASNPNAGSEGFEIEILDSGGTVIASATVLPTDNVLTSFSLPVTFPAIGVYTLRMTEVGPDDSLGAIIDNVSLLVCFLGGTQIRTPCGSKHARDIVIGDLVETERGAKPVRWVGRRTVSVRDIVDNDKFLPVKITAGALGCELPEADLWVSRQHRMLVQSPICERMFGQSGVLVAAIRLTALPGIYVDTKPCDLDYIHLLFDDHEIVYAEGAPSESLLLGHQAQQALSPEALEEIQLIFPKVKNPIDTSASVKYIPDNHKQSQLVHRLSKNNKPVLGSPQMRR